MVRFDFWVAFELDGFCFFLFFAMFLPSAGVTGHGEECLGGTGHVRLGATLPLLLLPLCYYYILHRFRG